MKEKNSQLCTRVHRIGWRDNTKRAASLLLSSCFRCRGGWTSEFPPGECDWLELPLETKVLPPHRGEDERADIHKPPHGSGGKPVLNPAEGEVNEVERAGKVEALFCPLNEEIECHRARIQKREDNEP